MPQELSLFGSDAPLLVPELLFNLLIGVVLSIIVRWHFSRFGSTLSNRDEFAQVFPFIILTTILIISVVKSSLALSLGLVGALSIVRFRTPIKEPEELAYLFISIAIGLGLGASQTVPTVVSIVFILGALALLKWARRERSGKQLFLSLDWQGEDAVSRQGQLTAMNKVIVRHAAHSDLRRYDVRDNLLSATYLVDIRDDNSLNALIDDLRDTFPDINATFLDQNHLPSV
ncbi:MAG: DUF4956 domain-containing protein [Gammaproteobacteria bacterium]|nr:DUF4956 domain-containing protein [Gammaproteobacteria bacterium]MCP4090516.1 DUF4956 domain-containing protein [Gammaproteobacteria bacterium]MCP4276619.1 DUF4956 domain-containing protein [Gammaproteobacteria bacterium]MCP4831369.1 DUF4956 domain-containing protein [Gammaproteobacteria bacterium]MCP4927913.1 DUF4956 domain-containing protein [Gammaproteobacteria bacterium]